MGQNRFEEQCNCLVCDCNSRFITHPQTQGMHHQEFTRVNSKVKHGPQAHQLEQKCHHGAGLFSGMQCAYRGVCGRRGSYYITLPGPRTQSSLPPSAFQVQVVKVCTATLGLLQCSLWGRNDPVVFLREISNPAIRISF